MKVYRVAGKKKKEELPAGLKADALQELPPKGLPAIVITNEDNKVTEIRILPARKKKKVD